MGWASGSQLAAAIWDIFKDYVPADAKQLTAAQVMKVFKDEDCDTLDEAEGLYNTALPWQVIDGEYIEGQFATREEAEEEAKGYSGAVVQHVGEDDEASSSAVEPSQAEPGDEP